MIWWYSYWSKCVMEHKKILIYLPCIWKKKTEKKIAFFTTYLQKFNTQLFHLSCIKIITRLSLLARIPPLICEQENIKDQSSFPSKWISLTKKTGRQNELSALCWTRYYKIYRLADRNIKQCLRFEYFNNWTGYKQS